MLKNRSAVRAGLLMIGSVALIVCVVIGIKGMGWIKDKDRDYVVVFDLKTNIGGLRVGDEVRVGGFKVGDIKRITLREDKDPKRPPYYIVIEFGVPERYSIRRDAVVRIDGTLTGTSWLNFEDLGKGEPLGADGFLVGGPSATSEMIAKVGGMVPELQGILADVRTKTLPAVNGALADVRGQTVPLVNETLTNFRKAGENTAGLTADVRESYKPVVLAEYVKVTEKAVAMMEAIRALFGDTTADFRTTVANLRATTDKLPPIMAKVDGMLTKVETAVANLDKTMAEVHTTVVNTRDLTAGARAIVVGNRSKFDNMVASLKTAGDNLKAATAEIRRSPWRLLYKPAPNEMANLNLYDAARQFAEGASDLNDTAGALRDALKNEQATPEELKALMEKVDRSFGNFKQVEEKLYDAVKK
jgi:ABC-type transporter Mla subunit MlaD